MSPDLAPLDALNLLFLPLMAITAVQALKNWKTLWDDKLTAADRQLLQRITIFLLLPMVVMCHELGHVAAIKTFGGTVVEFHYAFLSGYVVPGESYPPDKTVWLYFSGNLVQIIIGLLAAAGAVVASSPPVVALLVYLALWAVGGTAIIYALLSVSGLYGDWIHIYASPAHELVLSIACFHSLMVILVLWALYSERSRLWYTEKIDPIWSADHKKLLARVTLEPNAENWLNLGWSFYRKELYRASSKCLAKVYELAPRSPAACILEATIADARGQLNKAIKCYEELISNPDLPQSLKVMALMALGQCQLKQRRPDQALTTYGRAIETAPDLADPHFFKAAVLSDAGRLKEAEEELAATTQLKWLDGSLMKLVNEQLIAIRNKRQQKQ